MKLTISGEKVELRDGMTVSEYLEEICTNPKQVAVEINLNIIHREDFDVTVLKDGDDVEIVQFMGGGR